MENTMPVNFMYSFPLSHEQAVFILEDAPWSPAEKRWVQEGCLQSLYHPLGDEICKYWRLGDQTYPLPRHYMKRFLLGDSGDMSCLIILDFLAKLRNEKFNLAGYVHEFRRQWHSRGIDPLTLEKIRKTP
jgi:hypothetical protein